MYKIAVDIGGTNIKLAVINNELNIIDYKTIATPDNIHILITNEIYLIIDAFIKNISLKSSHWYLKCWRCRFNSWRNCLHWTNYSKF